MIESESLLERKFLGVPRKRFLPERKLLTAEIDLSKLSVWLQRRFRPAAALVFENRIAEIKVNCEQYLQKAIFARSRF